MIETTTLIADVQGEFEGGNSLSVDWDTLIRRAVENVLDNIRPETLKRRVPMYGGLAQDLHVYYAAQDILVASSLYDNEGQRLYGDGHGERGFRYVPPAEFYRRQKLNQYTIEYINGALFVVINFSSDKSVATVDEMNSVGTKTGGTPTLNQHNFLFGTGAVQSTFTDAGVELKDTITSVDYSDYMRGIALVPAYLTSKDDLTSIEFRLTSSAGNYFSVITTADSISDYLINGWNMIRFDLGNASETGTPDNTAITEWSIIGTTDSGKTLTIIIDKITLQKSAPFYLEYYSNYSYISGSTNALWQSTVSNANQDKINFNRDVAGILHYELCLLVVQSATFDNIDSNEATRFRDQLKRKYDAYWEKNPSSQALLTYSKSPEIDISQDIDYGRLQDDTESLPLN